MEMFHAAGAIHHPTLTILSQMNPILKVTKWTLQDGCSFARRKTLRDYLRNKRRWATCDIQFFENKRDGHREEKMHR